MAPPKSFILHVDATHKMNFREYPVLVVGMSDRSRGFHLVALYIVSQETQDVIQPALMALRRLHFWITSRELVVKYTMADADQAQFNALSVDFGGAGFSMLWKRSTKRSKASPRSWRVR
ncbi:hypothetical protein PF004_g22263 [Phytophthora fragariae]|uniref:MULE transposase domain-containing protein n=1 Tax=Phytophthora fragariae TaxID=53985 RepID=A0A6G0N0K4_9STRA|nr:hypothetical protein PF004_g22263 [Phytophthora fragariae]